MAEMDMFCLHPTCRINVIEVLASGDSAVPSFAYQKLSSVSNSSKLWSRDAKSTSSSPSERSKLINSQLHNKGEFFCVMSITESSSIASATPMSR